MPITTQCKGIVDVKVNNATWLYTQCCGPLELRLPVICYRVRLVARTYCMSCSTSESKTFQWKGDRKVKKVIREIVLSGP